MQRTQYRTRRPSRKPASRRRRLSDKSCLRNRALVEALVAHFEWKWTWPGFDGRSEAERYYELQRQAERLRREKARRRLEEAERKAELLGGLHGPVRPEQREASAAIDRALEELK